MKLNNKKMSNNFDIKNNSYIEEPWNIIESYFKGEYLEKLVRHQLESYNNFVGIQINKTINMFNPISIKSDQDYDPKNKKHSLEISITFENFQIYRPQIHENNGSIKLMFPQEARLRNFTYCSSITIDIHIKYIVRTGPELENIQIFNKILPKIHIGKLPIMLKSNICVLNQYKHFEHTQTGECKFDAGGYFIINGSEKTVLGQERAAENKIYCFNVSKNNTKYSWIAEIKSIPDFKCISPKQINMMISSKSNGFGNTIYLQLPRIKQPIPLFIIFRALNIISDKEICEKILLNISTEDLQYKSLLDALQGSIIEANKTLTKEESIKYITNFAMYTPINMDKETGIQKKLEFTIDILNNDLFPHCQTQTQKIYFLGYMANKLLQASFEMIKLDDRDSYINKRIDLTGSLLNNLFRNYLNKLIKDMEKQVIREINNGSWKSTDDFTNIINLTNIYKIIKSSTIENGLKRALATGDFGIKHINNNKVGVAQVLSRLTYVSALSHARRISTPIDKSGKLIPPRKLHNTSWGFLCLTGDTEVLMSNRLTIKKLKDMKDGDRVNTVNIETLIDEPSDIHSFFCKMPDKLFEITTISGRKIKATANHPFLVNVDGKCEWKNLEDLKINDKMVVRYTVKDLSDNTTTIVKFNNSDYRTDLLKYINEIEPELVYDFTTRSDNHSFVASSFVCHNCPAETPEGQSVGVVKNLSYMTHITIASNSAPLYEYIIPQITAIDDPLLNPIDIFDKVKVFINGCWVGISNDPQNLYLMLKDKKYKGIINIYTSIIFDYRLKELRICNDGGRLTRPLLRVKNNNILINNSIITKLQNNELNWDTLLTSSTLEESIIEYVDPDEQNWAMIATKPKNLLQNEIIYNFTHCEIHPSTIFGVLASCIPFPEHNQSPRNCYQCLDIHELVWLANGTKKMIKDVRAGDFVLTFHPETLEISETIVVNQFVRPSTTKNYKIIFKDDVNIIATDDHKFMTSSGWATVNTIINYNLEIGLYNKLINKCEFLPILHFELMPSNILVSCIEVKSTNHSFIVGKGTKGFLSSNCAQGKQAMGVYVTNYQNRMDKTAYVLNYPSRPFVDTRIMNMIQLNKIPSGANVIVAIMTHTGYNQEDSLLFNQGSIDRGLFMTTIYHTEKDEDKQKINGDEEIRCKPDPTKTKGMKMGNYNKVNSKGVIPENTIVQNRDIIIAKVIPIKQNRNDPTKIIKFEDQSKIFKTSEETYVDKNYIDRNGDGYNFAKIRLRTTRKPVIGDKFCALPTQQVLTDKGWIEIKDIDITIHKVATLDTNKNMCYEFPIAKYEYDHDDKMYYIKNKQVHIICTLNHKLYVKQRTGKKYELIEAQDVMGKMVRFQKTMTNVYPDIEFITIGEIQYKMDDWLQLLGMFIADGYSYNKSINITALKERKQLFNKNLLEKLNIEYKYSKDGKFIINGKKNKNVCEHLDILSVGALNKYLPEYVWNLSQRQSIILLEALLQGDGSSMEYKGETFDRYGTISIKLANDITRLALHCGWSGIVKMSEEPTGIARIGKRNLGSRAGQVVSITQQHTYYKVSIIVKQNEPWINKKVNDSNEEKLIDYKGKVYCIEVPSSHTYYMRESTNSPCLIIGNSSRHGQKGTIGNIIPECDMPFTKNGVKPDIIINPHAIPSRMTIGQLKETVLGKVLVELGLFGDGTSFGEFEIKDICKELLNLGYESNGNELMYNGLTGEQLECSVFIGPVFYQRLKHMVNDKTHSRSIGPMVNLTRQPAEGRSRDGGLRFGEMEKDAMVSHGAARFTRERMYDVSDKYSVHVCNSCGLIASYNDKMHIHHCRTCDNRTDFTYVEIPYACKLLFQELNTMNIAPRIMAKY
jgi:DNA-directed RNA polymerase beta subunit